MDDLEKARRIQNLDAERELIQLKAERERSEAEAAKRTRGLEDQLLELEIGKREREEAAARIISQRPSQKYWFIPSSTKVLQTLGATLALVASFFFLYQPVVDARKEIAGKESRLAALEADIQEQENIKLKNTLERERDQLKAANEKIEKDFTALIEAEKEAALSARKEASKLRNRLATARATSAAERDAQQARIDQLERAASAASARAAKVTTTRDTRLIAGETVSIFATQNNAAAARRLQNALDEAGAKFATVDLEYDADTAASAEGRNTFGSPDGSSAELKSQLEKLAAEYVDPPPERLSFDESEFVFRLYAR